MPIYTVDVPEALCGKFLLLMREILGITVEQKALDIDAEQIPPGGVTSPFIKEKWVKAGPVTMADIRAWAKDGGVALKTVHQLLEAGVSPDDMTDVIDLRWHLSLVRVRTEKSGDNKVDVLASPTIEAMINAYHQCDDDIDILTEAVDYALENVNTNTRITAANLNAALYESIRVVVKGGEM